MKYSIDIEELERLYLVEHKTCRQIGAMVGIPHRTIQRYLKASGVQMRNPGTPVVDQLADREWLRREYLVRRRSTTVIAAALGCSPHSVSLWLKRHGLDARPSGAPRGHNRNTEAARCKMSLARRGKQIGSQNPNWRGGICTKDPDRNRYRSKMWVKAVKDRDGWRCVECGARDLLHAHHIKRWKDYPDLRFDVANGKTLCHECHEAAHGRGFRFRWTQARKKAHERTGVEMQDA